MDFEAGHDQEFSSVTQCPYCDTAFHVGLSQLDTAGGRVRCGGCLRVFNAKEHFLVEQKRLFDDAPATEERREVETEIATGAVAPEDIAPPSVDLLGAEIIEDDGPVILGDFNHDGGQSIPRNVILKHEVDHLRQADYQPAPLEDVPEVADAATRFEPESEPCPEPRSQLASGPGEISENAKEPLEQDLGAEASLENDLQKVHPIVDSAPLYDVQEPSPSREPNQTTAVSETSNAPAQSHSSEFFIEHPRSETAASRPDKFVWSAALAFIILIIPAQLMYRPPVELVERPWFRQIGGLVCPYLGCETPVYVHLDALRISGFIEPHSQYKNSLVAKIDLRNTAKSEQPFPSIAIFFRNFDDEITASREFTPRDYLRGEARAYKLMPVNRNIRLEIEILDPGEQSTSYEIFVQGSYIPRNPLGHQTNCLFFDQMHFASSSGKGMMGGSCFWTMPGAEKPDKYPCGSELTTLKVSLSWHRWRA